VTDRVTDDIKTERHCRRHPTTRIIIPDDNIAASADIKETLSGYPWPVTALTPTAKQ
jgi:hypothetical protein